MFRVVPSDSSEFEIMQDASVPCGVLVVGLATRGGVVLVGDVMRSVTALAYRADSGKFDDIGRDVNSHWTTACAALDADTYVYTENSGNIVTLRRAVEATSDDDRKRLETVGMWHVGDCVNRIRAGALAMRGAEGLAAECSIFVTVHGAIGVIVSLTDEQFEFFSRLEKVLASVIRGVGGLEHAE
jgi:DNA damage-binding protein 1